MSNGNHPTPSPVASNGSHTKTDKPAQDKGKPAGKDTPAKADPKG